MVCLQLLYPLGWRIFITVRFVLSFLEFQFTNLAEALLQYAMTLAFYLHLRASDEYSARPELLRSHAIMSRLLAFKQHITTLEELEDDDR